VVQIVRVVEQLFRDQIAEIRFHRILNLFIGKLRFGGYSTLSKTIAENGVLLQIKVRLVQETRPNAPLPVQLTYATAAVRASESAENVFEEKKIEAAG